MSLRVNDFSREAEMVPKSADCATAGPKRCPPGPSAQLLPPGPLLGAQVGMAQLLCSRGVGSPGQGYGPSGVAGATVSFGGGSPLSCMGALGGGSELWGPGGWTWSEYQPGHRASGSSAV